MAFSDLGPSGVHLLRLALGFATLIVCGSLGYAAAKNWSGAHAKKWGWLVGLSLYFIFYVLGTPARDGLRRAECRDYSGEEFTACLEDGPYDPYED